MANIANLLIDQGTDFETIVTYSDDTGVANDLTDYTARSQIRKSYYSANATASFTVNITDAVNGEITISLDSATSSNVKAGRYLYDLELVNNTTSKVTRLIEGIVTFMPEITK